MIFVQVATNNMDSPVPPNCFQMSTFTSCNNISKRGFPCTHIKLPSKSAVFMI